MAIPRLNEPPGKPEPYIIPPYAGEAITIPGTKSVVRILASAKETDRLISVFRMDGVTGDPVGFHYHEHAHDVFMCTKGRMKVSIDDQCRILGPGDFAYAPPVSKQSVSTTLQPPLATLSNSLDRQLYIALNWSTRLLRPSAS